MRQVIGFASLTGELEKSHLPLNLAACLARQGKRTLLVDLSCPTPALDILGGCAETVVYTAMDVACERVPLSRAVLPLPVKKSKGQAEDLLFLLPSSPTERFEEETQKRLLRIIRAEADHDVVLVWFSHQHAAREGIDGLFLLTAADEVSVRAAEAWQSEHNADAFLLTGFATDWEDQQRKPSVLSLVDRLGLSLLGIVPRLPMGLSGIIVDGSFGRARAYTKAIENVTARFCGKDTPLLKGVPLTGISRKRYLTKAE